MRLSRAIENGIAKNEQYDANLSRLNRVQREILKTNKTIAQMVLMERNVNNKL